VNPIRVLLADDHKLLRSGLKSLLQGMPDIEVVAEAETGLEAVRLIEEFRPHVVVMDVMMPDLNGLDATARAVAANPSVQVVMLSMNSDEHYVLQAVRAGARGYLLKNTSPTELEQAIRTVARGEMFFSSAIARHLVTGCLQRSAQIGDSLARLTPRQREVLQLLAEGNSTKEMARKLQISVKTVEAHRAQLMDVLDIHDVASLTRYAIRVGLISPSE